MADNKEQSLHLKVATNKFFNALKNNASDQELAAIINSEPNLLSSKEFIKKTYPSTPKNKDSAGLVSMDKMMQTIRKVKSLEANGFISHDQVKNFLSGKHPQTGETFATYTAKQAVAAYDKANIDRSPEPNFSEDARNKFSQQQKMYSTYLQEMEELGVPMDLPNKQGKTVQDIAGMGLLKDINHQSPALSGQQPNQENSEALHVNIKENEEDLEVGGEEKEALKVNLENKKALKVDLKPKPKEKVQEDEEEATVEDAPEDDQSKPGEYKGDPIKERDIIDYMYNEWFIASLDWAVNGTVNHIVSSVDNLCDDFAKKAKTKHAKDVKDNKDKYNKNGHRVLNEIPKTIHNSYSSNKDEARNMWEDIKNNLGKDPQEWTYLNPNDPKQQRFIETMNREYKENPEACRQKVTNILDTNEQVQNFNNRIHMLAADLAAIELTEENMKRGKVKRTIYGDKPLSKMTDEKIEKDLTKRTAQKSAELVEVINKLSLYAELRMAKDDITDPKIIEQRKTEYIAAWINETTKHANLCKNALSNDLDNENYKYANNSLSKETKTTLNELKKLMKVDEIGTLVMQNNYKKTESYDLRDAAKEMYTEAPIEIVCKQYAAEASKTQYSYEDNHKRKEAFNQWKDKILNSSKFEDIVQKDTMFNNLYNNTFKGNGR